MTVWRRIGLLVSRFVLFAAIASGIVALAYQFRPDPRVYSTAEINTELVRYDVVDPRKAAFFISGVRIGQLGKSDGNCGAGLFTPARGTTVTLARGAKGPLEITLTPTTKDSAVTTVVGVLEPAGTGPALPFRGTTAMLIDKKCAPPSVQRLPIWGPLRIGQEFRPAFDRDAPTPNFLLSGKLEVAAHTVLWSTPYQVTTVTIPVGARLQADDNTTGLTAERAIWWGTATIDIDHSAIDLIAATEAPVLAVYRPNQTGADVIRLSVLTEVTKDPSYLLMALLLGMGIFAFEKCLGVVEHWKKTTVHDRHDDGRATQPKAAGE